MVQAAPQFAKPFKDNLQALADAVEQRDSSSVRDLRAAAASNAAATASGAIATTAATPKAAAPATIAPKIEIFREYDAAESAEPEPVIYDDSADFEAIADSPFVAMPPAQAPVSTPVPIPSPAPQPVAQPTPQPVAPKTPPIVRPQPVSQAPAPMPVSVPRQAPAAAPAKPPVHLPPPKPIAGKRPGPSMQTPGRAPVRAAAAPSPMSRPQPKPPIKPQPPRLSNLTTVVPNPPKAVTKPKVAAPVANDRRGPNRPDNGAWIRENGGTTSRSVTHVTMPGVAFRSDVPIAPGTLRPFEWTEDGRHFSATICVIACTLRRNGMYDIRANLV
ncbi:MAG: hypothetical protein AAGK78_02015 [Planctomycetota bacterium]